jgi:NAD-dependent dihydropyrimidine dehydrogenase PreA subunit
MGEFIRVVIDPEKCGDPDEVKVWAGVCPVGIFEMKKGRPFVAEENEDECTLCELCLEACSNGAVTIEKLYE